MSKRKELDLEIEYLEKKSREVQDQAAQLKKTREECSEDSDTEDNVENDSDFNDEDENIVPQGKFLESRSFIPFKGS